MIDQVRKFFGHPIIDLLLRLAILASLFASIYLGYEQNNLSKEQNRLATCQVNFNKVTNSVQNIRANLTERDRDALDKMIKTVATAKTQQTVGKALQTYISTRNATDLERDKNPIPKIRDFCG